MRNSQKTCFLAQIWLSDPVSMGTRVFSNIPCTLQKTPYKRLTSCTKSKKSNVAFQRNLRKTRFLAQIWLSDPVSMGTRVFGNIPYTLQKTPYKRLTSCTKSKKSNVAFQRNLRKTRFFAQIWPFDPVSTETRVFLKKSKMSVLSPYGYITSCKISEKSNERFLRKSVADARTDARTDGRNQIHRTLFRLKSPTFSNLILWKKPFPEVPSILTNFITAENIFYKSW